MLEIDRSEWLASQFLKETMGSPISRPRQVANTRPCTARAHPFVHQDCSFKTASPVLELTARLVPKALVAPQRTSHPGRAGSGLAFCPLSFVAQNLSPQLPFHVLCF